MKLAAGLCFYEKSLPSIRRCIESIKNHVDIILAIDGRFDHFPDTQPLSTPEVRAYLSSVENLVLVDCPGTEIQKRQRYCDLCREHGCDWLLIIDSDEYILEPADWNALRDNLGKLEMGNGNIYGIPFAYSAPVHMDTTAYPRLWHFPWEVRYVKHNLWETARQGTIQSTSESPLIPGIIMAGDNNLVTPEFIEQGRQYQRYLISQENPVEKTWSELFEEADIKGKIDLFNKAGGSGKSAMNDLIEALAEALSLKIIK